jgi:hypothetical protein
VPYSKTLAAIQTNMGQLYYNRQRNDRIKNIVLGAFVVLVFWLFSLFVRTVDKKSINLYHGLLFGVLLIVVNYLLRLIPFGQVFESFDKKKFRTYYRLGRLKFKRREWDQADKVLLEQDQKRFYCIVVKTVNGQTFEVERCPTLKQSEERLNEFKNLFN